MKVIIKIGGMERDAGQSFWTTYKAGRALTFFAFYGLFIDLRLFQILGRKFHGMP